MKICHCTWRALKREPIWGSGGLCPQWGPGAKPLVRVSGGFAPPCSWWRFSVWKSNCAWIFKLIYNTLHNIASTNNNRLICLRLQLKKGLAALADYKPNMNTLPLDTAGYRRFHGFYKLMLIAYRQKVQAWPALHVTHYLPDCFLVSLIQVKKFISDDMQAYNCIKTIKSWTINERHYF